jgi:hypothetical protein
MKNLKERATANLDETCEGVKNEYGTLRPFTMSLDHNVTRQIDACYRIGVAREEVEIILLKYQD